MHDRRDPREQRAHLLAMLEYGLHPLLREPGEVRRRGGTVCELCGGEFVSPRGVAVHRGRGCPGLDDAPDGVVTSGASLRPGGGG